MAKHLVAIVLSFIGTSSLLGQSGSSAGRMILQLHESDWMLQAGALNYLAKYRVASASKPIGDLLENKRTRPWLRGRALVALTRIEGAGVQDHVLKFAQDQDTLLRAAAAEALEYLPGEDLETTLQGLLKDRDRGVRYRALAAVAKRHGTKAWPVVDSMTESLDESTGQWGARALARVGSDAALQRLENLASHEELFSPVIRGIQDISDSRLTRFLLRILKALDVQDKRFTDVLTALQQFDQQELLTSLEANLKTGDEGMIRTVALLATLLIPSPELGDSLRQAVARVDNRNTIQAVLVALGPETMQPDRHREFFVEYLDHGDAEIRALAVRCLAHCHKVNLYQQLRERVEDSSPVVVETVLGALHRASVEDAPRGKLVEFLKTPLESDDPEVRSKAYSLLAHAGTAEDFKPAMAMLADCLRSTDDEIRNQAAATLGRFAPASQIDAVVRYQGYVARWMILGTFLNDKENKGFNRPFPPEMEIDFKAKYQAKYLWVLNGQIREKGELEREIAWSQATVDQTDGKLNIPALVPPPAALAVAYAVADFHVAADQEVFLSVDGDDAFRVWLNGAKVVEKVAPYKPRSDCVAIENGIKVSLRRGANRFLVKTTNIDHQWWLRLRLTNTNGEPVEIQP